MERAGDENPVHRDADLAHVGEGAAGGGGGRFRHVGILEDDEGRLAAEFQDDPLQVAGGRAHDRLAGGGRGGRGDRLNAGMGGEGRAGLGVAGKIVEDAGRQAGLDKAFDDPADGERRLGRRLGDHRAAGGENRADLPAVEIDRIVPRHDGADHAERRMGDEAADIARATRDGDCRRRGGPPPRSSG